MRLGNKSTRKEQKKNGKTEFKSGAIIFSSQINFKPLTKNLKKFFLAFFHRATGPPNIMILRKRKQKPAEEKQKPKNPMMQKSTLFFGNSQCLEQRPFEENKTVIKSKL